MKSDKTLHTINDSWHDKSSKKEWVLFLIVGDFDAASLESNGTSFTVAGVCSGCLWFEREFVVMHRSQYIQLPRYYNSLNSILDPIANQQILHTYPTHSTSQINPVAWLIGNDQRYGFNYHLFWVLVEHRPRGQWCWPRRGDKIHLCF